MKNMVNFSIEGLDTLLNKEWRWMFRDEPQKWVDNLKDTLVGLTTEQASLFFKGALDVKVEGEEVVLVKTQNDLSEEIVQWMRRQLIENGEAIECYFEGIGNASELVRRDDFDWQDDYLEEIEAVKKQYRNYYDNAVAKFQMQKDAFAWINNNWFDNQLPFPKIRSFKEIERDNKISDLHCTNFSKVDYHALVMTVDGEVYWYGEWNLYAIMQHINLHNELRNLGINSIDSNNNLNGQSNIYYDPSHYWRINIAALTKRQIETLIQFALDRGEDCVYSYGNKFPIEKLAALLSGEIQWHEI